MKLVWPFNGGEKNHFPPLFVLALYALLSLLYLGPRTVRDWSKAYHGLGFDPTIQMWAMIWWPYAIAHRLNPFTTPVIWAPMGYNLACTTSIPGPSIIISPVTMVFGPVVAYNLLCVACPAAAAFSAFLLCRYICQSFWPALLGGYMFGFSQYVLSQTGGHLFLVFIFPVPIAIYLVLLRLDSRISKYSFVVLFVLVVAFEFLSSTELFATSTLFGAMALSLCFTLFTDLRARLKNTIADVGLAYAVLIVILSPYLYKVLAGGLPPVANSPEAYSNDLLALAIPTPVLLGGNLFEPISRQFRFSWGEMSAYVGPGMWLILVLFARSYWGTRVGKLLLLSFGLITLASLGPKLHIAGHAHVRLPWLIPARLPLLDLALPGRFGMYLFLVGGVIAALYLSRPGIPLWSKALLGACAFAFIVPNLAFIQLETTSIDAPFFFQSRQYQRYISKGDIILILPTGAMSQAMLWQAQTSFYFRLTTGFYIPPSDYQRWPITASFLTNNKILNFSEQLDAFLGANQVRAIILDANSPGPWPAMLSQAGLTAAALGGVLFYRVPAKVLTSFRNATAHQMAEKQAANSFDALVIAASRYIDGGFPLAKLALSEAQRLKLLTLRDGELPLLRYSSWWQNLWLGNRGGLVRVGVVGNYEDLEFLIDDFAPEATDIYFPFPKRLRKGPKSGSGLLLFDFTPEGLRRAANKVATRASTTEADTSPSR
jgi:hypothetical protein